MRTYSSLPVIVLAGLEMATAAARGSEPPLPPGATLRLGDTRFLPGVRITHLAFSPDGKQLASWGNWLYFEDRFSLWDTATGKELFAQAMPENRICDLCWGFALRSSSKGFGVWSFPESVRPADPLDKPVAPGLPTPPPLPDVGSLHATLSRDGTRLAVYRSETGAPSGTVDLYETKACRALSELRRIAKRASFSGGKCLGLKIARGGKAVVAMTETKTKGEQSVVVWDTDKDTLSSPVTVLVGVEQGNRQSCDVADDGSALAIGMSDGNVKVYDLPSCKERLSVKKHDGPKRGGRWSEVSAVKFVNGGRQLLSAGRDNSQVVWDAQTGADVAQLDGHASWVEAIAVSADGRRVATAGQDSLIRLWDAATWKPILAPHGPRESIWRLEVSPDGRHAAAGSGDGAHVWELATGRELRSPASDYRSGYVLFTPDGKVLVGDAQQHLRVLDIVTGTAAPVAATGRLLNFSPDGKTLLTAEGHNVLVWDWPACTRRRTVALKAEPQSAAFAADGHTVVLGPGWASILDLISGKLFDLPMKLHWFTNAAGFSADGREIYGTTGGPKAEVWSLGMRSQARQFEQPEQRPPGHFYLLSFAVSPDRRRAVSCQSDGGVAVYELVTGQVLAHFKGHREGVTAVAWTPDSNSVLSGGGDHQVLVWDVSVRHLAGKVDKLSAQERLEVWDRLARQPAKEAIKTLASLAADPEGSVALLAERLKPQPAVADATLDRIFKDLDDASFATRAKAARELKALGAGAVAGVRARSGKTTSAEVKRRAEDFLEQFDKHDTTSDRVRFLRALEALALIDSPDARRLVEGLAAGAAQTWETDTAQAALRSMKARNR
jgi:WD40 repeat protein